MEDVLVGSYHGCPCQSSFSYALTVHILSWSKMNCYPWLKIWKHIQKVVHTSWADLSGYQENLGTAAGNWLTGKILIVPRLMQPPNFLQWAHTEQEGEVRDWMAIQSLVMPDEWQCPLHGIAFADVWASRSPWMLIQLRWNREGNCQPTCCHAAKLHPAHVRGAVSCWFSSRRPF